MLSYKLAILLAVIYNFGEKQPVSLSLNVQIIYIRKCMFIWFWKRNQFSRPWRARHWCLSDVFSLQIFFCWISLKTHTCWPWFSTMKNSDSPPKSTKAFPGNKEIIHYQQIIATISSKKIDDRSYTIWVERLGRLLATLTSISLSNECLMSASLSLLEVLLRCAYESW